MDFQSSTPSTNPGMYQPKPSRSPRSTWMVWLILLVLILVGVLWISGKTPRQIVPGQRGESEEIAPGTTLTQAPEGKVVAGFPTELILESDVAAGDSYSIAYANDDIAQPVVSYTSKRTLQENIDAYGAYLALNGWNVSHEADASEDPVFFYASKGSADVNITFAEEEPVETMEGEMVQHIKVTIAYLERGE